MDDRSDIQPLTPPARPEDEAIVAGGIRYETEAYDTAATEDTPLTKDLGPSDDSHNMDFYVGDSSGFPDQVSLPSLVYLTVMVFAGVGAAYVVTLLT